MVDSSIRFMVDSSIHFKVVPTKSIPLLTMIQLGSDARDINFDRLRPLSGLKPSLQESYKVQVRMGWVLG